VPGVPQCKVERSVEAIHEVVSFSVVQVEQDLAVGSGLELVTFGLGFGTKLTVVIDLAITHQPQGLLDIRQRLVTTGQIDDGQAAHIDAASAMDMHALIVQPTVR